MKASRYVGSDQGMEGLFFLSELTEFSAGADRLAEASLEDFCMVVLFLFLLFTTLLLPWLLL